MPCQTILEEFGQRLGVTLPRERGSATITLEGLGWLTLETSADESELLATLAAPLPPYDDQMLLAALRQCHPDRVRPFSLACGLAKDRLLFISRQKIAELTAARLENQAIFLIACAKELGVPGA